MMRNIERFPSKQMYPYLSLVERKVADFYHNIISRQFLVSLTMPTTKGTDVEKGQ